MPTCPCIWNILSVGWNFFEANLLQHFEGDKADEALERAGKMAKLFHSKREFLRQHGV